MTQEEKNLLLQDLCARLPYEVKVWNEGDIFNINYISSIYEEIHLDIADNYTIDVSEVKPYLFPLSSMSEEQKKEWRSLMIHDSYGILYPTIKSFDYLYKNHIDIRGLIPMGLAIDATNLKIY